MPWSMAATNQTEYFVQELFQMTRMNRIPVHQSICLLKKSSHEKFCKKKKVLPCMPLLIPEIRILAIHLKKIEHKHRNIIFKRLCLILSCLS